MREQQFYDIMQSLLDGDLTIGEAHEQILSLMGENGNGVSDSLAENGALPHVGKSECERSDSTEVSSESEHGTLENRIDSGSFFCGEFFVGRQQNKCNTQCDFCVKYIEKTKES